MSILGKTTLALAILPLVMVLISADFREEGSVLFKVDFENDQLGTYSDEQLLHDFSFPRWNDGVTEGRVTIVVDDNNKKNRCIRVLYPQGAVGPKPGGAQWDYKLGQTFDELYCSYRVKFGKKFDFIKGGKLPGLAGGKTNTGGHRPDGTDGWSARMMWRKEGKAVQYVYHADQASNYGDDFEWRTDYGASTFLTNQWYTVEHHVVMNTPGNKDGRIEAWLDGVKVLDKTDLRFREGNNFGIDTFMFSTFFGGNDPSWGPTKEEFTYFDDFIVSTQRITKDKE
jgi:hypothetical protein